MKMSFACPSCAAEGSVDASFLGRQVRCKHCNHRFAIRVPDETAADQYALEEPITPARTSAPEGQGLVSGSVFVSKRGDDANAFVAPRRPRTTSRPGAKVRRGESPGFAWGAWLLGLGLVTALLLIGTALFAPNGRLIVGSSLLVIGSVMVLLGFGAGLYGAFCEDFLYGFLYLVIPLYSGYYMLTRWDDLWPWFACSTTGVVLATLGGQLVR